jgi:polyvinyl alcohol dehydrogenase (cytochrome)
LRGSVSALDAATGAILWKTYSIAAEPQPKGRNPRGVQQYGPAGGGIWNSPTIDAKRGLLYVGTGNGFAEPAQPTTNSILAIDLLTGMIRWKFQALANDVWLWQCDPGTPTHTANCPRNQGPDHDFGSSPLLVTTPAGRDLVIAAQKSGMLWALDPDHAGAVVWQYRLGAGSPLNGQWGAASDGRNVYAGSSEAKGPAPGGIHAVDLDTGRRTWFTPAQPQLCGDAPPPTCFASQGAAASVIPGVVFSGSVDGGLRAYSTKDGAVLWTYDSNRYFDTVNGVIARGASMDASGPVIAGGMLFVNSGYAGLVGRPGNVLLAFRLE